MPNILVAGPQQLGKAEMEMARFRCSAKDASSGLRSWVGSLASRVPAVAERGFITGYRTYVDYLGLVLHVLRSQIAKTFGAASLPASHLPTAAPFAPSTWLLGGIGV